MNGYPVPARIDRIPDHLLDLGEFLNFPGPLLRGEFIVPFKFVVAYMCVSMRAN
jgi:hypothetical protein